MQKSTWHGNFTKKIRYGSRELVTKYEISISFRWVKECDKNKHIWKKSRNPLPAALLTWAWKQVEYPKPFFDVFNVLLVIKTFFVIFNIHFWLKHAKSTVYSTFHTSTFENYFMIIKGSETKKFYGSKSVTYLLMNNKIYPTTPTPEIGNVELSRDTESYRNNVHSRMPKASITNLPSFKQLHIH